MFEKYSQENLKIEYWQGQGRYNSVVYSYPDGSKEIVKTNAYFHKNESGITETKTKKLGTFENNGCFAEKNKKRYIGSVQRSKRNVRRLIQANPDLTRFVTLTYAENMSNRDKGFRDFKNFVKRVRFRFPKIKYIVVAEYQDRGAIHFHLLINQYIPQKLLEEVWGHGWVYIEYVQSRKKAIWYISKYMSEDFLQHGIEKKLYSRSRNLDVAKRSYYDILDLERFINSLDMKNVDIFVYNLDDVVEGLEVVQVFAGAG